MEESVSRIAIVGIIVADSAAVEAVNGVLHEFGGSILGRLGLPVRERGINTISIVVDAPTDVVNSLTGRLGAIRGVSARALFAKV